MTAPAPDVAPDVEPDVEPELGLYVDRQYASPYAMSAFVALHEKELPFRVQTVDLAAHENQVGDYAQSSLTQRVPMLVHGDFSLSESSAITEYLDEAFDGPRLYPTDPRARARARQLQAWLRSDLAALRQERPTDVLFFAPTQRPLSAAAKAAAIRLFGAAEQLLAHGEPNLFGDWCIADLDLAVMLARLGINGDPVPARLKTYLQAQWERPTVRTWLEVQRPAD